MSQLKWVVYAKKPFAGPQQVIDYVGRYTHRIAISNHRLLAIEQARVSFRWKDYRDGSKHKVMQLSAEEFIRRFLLHVLPKGFMRIRHYGLLASSGKEAKLKLCRLLLNSQLIIDRPADKTIINDEQPICPYCGKGRLVRKALLPHSDGPPSLLLHSLVA